MKFLTHSSFLIFSLYFSGCGFTSKAAVEGLSTGGGTGSGGSNASGGGVGASGGSGGATGGTTGAGGTGDTGGTGSTNANSALQVLDANGAVVESGGVGADYGSNTVGSVVPLLITLKNTGTDSSYIHVDSVLYANDGSIPGFNQAAFTLDDTSSSVDIPSSGQLQYAVHFANMPPGTTLAQNYAIYYRIVNNGSYGDPQLFAVRINALTAVIPQPGPVFSNSLGTPFTSSHVKMDYKWNDEVHKTGLTYLSPTGVNAYVGWNFPPSVVAWSFPTAWGTAPFSGSHLVNVGICYVNSATHNYALTLTLNGVASSITLNGKQGTKTAPVLAPGPQITVDPGASPQVALSFKAATGGDLRVYSVTFSEVANSCPTQ